MNRKIEKKGNHQKKAKRTQKKRKWYKTKKIQFSQKHRFPEQNKLDSRDEQVPLTRVCHIFDPDGTTARTPPISSGSISLRAYSFIWYNLKLNLDL